MEYEDIYEKVADLLTDFVRTQGYDYKGTDITYLATDITDIFEKELEAHERGERLKFGEMANPDINLTPVEIIEKQLLELKILRPAMETFKNTYRNTKPEVVDDVSDVLRKIDFATSRLKRHLEKEDERLTGKEYVIFYQKVAFQAKDIVEKYTGKKLFES